MENSYPMDGRAMFADDPINGVRKEAAVVTSRVIFLLTSGAFVAIMSSLINRTHGKLRHFVPPQIQPIYSNKTIKRGAWHNTHQVSGIGKTLCIINHKTIVKLSVCKAELAGKETILTLHPSSPPRRRGLRDVLPVNSQLEIFIKFPQHSRVENDKTPVSSPCIVVSTYNLTYS